GTMYSGTGAQGGGMNFEGYFQKSLLKRKLKDYRLEVQLDGDPSKVRLKLAAGPWIAAGKSEVQVRKAGHSGFGYDLDLETRGYTLRLEGLVSPDGKLIKPKSVTRIGGSLSARFPLIPAGFKLRVRGVKELQKARVRMRLKDLKLKPWKRPLR
ncbi:MAG: hypothetical protein AAF517_25625, partial [Planctomycetota bacterium]